MTETVRRICTSLAMAPEIALDYTPGIFGNANMGGTIDQKDVEYVSWILDGTEEPTDFADVDHDAEFDEEDVAQIEKIVDGNGNAVTNIPALGKRPKETWWRERPRPAAPIFTYRFSRWETALSRCCCLTLLTG